MSYRLLFLLLVLLLLLYAAKPYRPKLGYLPLVGSGLVPGVRASLLPPVDSLSSWSGCRAIALPDSGLPLRQQACFRRDCLWDVGRRLDVQYMLGGSIDRIGDSLLIGWRCISMQDELAEWAHLEVRPYREEDLIPDVQASLRQFLSGEPGQTRAVAPVASWRNKIEFDKKRGRTRLLALK